MVPPQVSENKRQQDPKPEAQVPDTVPPLVVHSPCVGDILESWLVIIPPPCTHTGKAGPTVTSRVRALRVRELDEAEYAAHRVICLEGIMHMPGVLPEQLLLPTALLLCSMGRAEQCQAGYEQTCSSCFRHLGHHCKTKLSTSRLLASVP